MNTLISIYDSQYSEWKTEYFNIIDKYLKTPIILTADEIEHPTDENYTEIHHINPRWYYKYNNIEVDNSPSNIVRLPYKMHIKCHLLLCRHFKTINDNLNYSKAKYAFMTMYTFANINISKDFNIFKDLTENEFDILTKARLTRMVKPYKKYPLQVLKQLADDYIKFGFEYVQNVYLFKAGVLTLRKMLKRRGLTFKRRKTHIWTYDEVLNLHNIYEKFGFNYFKFHPELLYYNNCRISHLYEIFERHKINYKKHKFNPISVTNGIIQYSLNSNEKIDLPSGWYFGTIHNIKTKTTKGYMHISDGIHSRFIPKTQKLPDGWYIGVPYHMHDISRGKKRIYSLIDNSIKYINMNDKIPDGYSDNNPMCNCIRITDGTNIKYIKLDTVIPPGWYKVKK